ncbi:MAG TPA: polyphenol oxidase family protein [Elusimicrobiota bacterium]|nr:polyphenol oxidase family protein [Elusimicrobiota bacterium]
MSSVPVKNSTGWVSTGGFFREERLVRLGVPHGVTTRALGSMKDAKLRRAALEKAGIGGLPLFLPHQVHGTKIEPIESAQPMEAPRADGWIFRRKDVAAGVYAADCLPIFIWERSGEAMGVFHSGWRGTAAGMPEAAGAAFRKFYGLGAERLCAAVGPHIGPCCYKVGEDVAAKFAAASARRRDGALYLDLGAEAKTRFVRAGIAEENISICKSCTCCESATFYSFRRQKEDCRMMAFCALSHGS